MSEIIYVVTSNIISSIKIGMSKQLISRVISRYKSKNRTVLF